MFILFLALEGVCALLVFNFNDYHKSAFMSSSNAVCGVVYSMEEGVSQYFHLGSANEQLASENAYLRNRIAKLEKRLAVLKDTLMEKNLTDSAQKYRYIDVRVINSTTNKSRNYLTLDKGASSGISRDMFVLNGSGVVGMVTAVSENYSTVLPIINTSMRLSVKMARTNYRGQLTWNGVSPKYATVVDIPEHAVINVGDSVVTSGSSSFFPEDIMVGIVDAVDMDKNGGFYKLSVVLSVDFSSVYDVEVVENKEQNEQRMLEEKNEE